MLTKFTNKLTVLFLSIFPQHLKTLKHPGIIKYFGTKRSREEIWILTEPVRPLEAVLDTLLAEEVCAGVYSLLQVLAFLHEVTSFPNSQNNTVNSYNNGDYCCN